VDPGIIFPRVYFRHKKYPTLDTSLRKPIELILEGDFFSRYDATLLRISQNVRVITRNLCIRTNAEQTDAKPCNCITELCILPGIEERDCDVGIDVR
jgi:hypothetical protein